MAQIKCDECGYVFDENGKVQCPNCDAPIGKFKLLCKNCNSPLFERIATLPQKGEEQLLKNSGFAKISAQTEFEYRKGKAKYSAKNPYPKALGKLSFIAFSIFCIMSFFSCISNGNQNKSQSDEIIVHNEINIPRTHSGISLGSSLSDVKRAIEASGEWVVDIDEDKEHNIIVFEFEEIGPLAKSKYYKFRVELFDGKVDIIEIIPGKNQIEIIEMIKGKYPFIERKADEFSWITMAYTRQLVCFDGMTEIAFPIERNRVLNHHVYYRDVALIKKKKEFWEKVEREKETEKKKYAEQEYDNY